MHLSLETNRGSLPHLVSGLTYTCLALISLASASSFPPEMAWWQQQQSAVASRQEPLLAVDPEPSPASPLECFQVTHPVFGYDGESDQPCTVKLMEHSFGNSYGAPFVGDYTPPSCSFNRVIMNFTVVSEGRQYDRLALMYFGDTEVWRTSTAEPTPPPGIRWTFTKDMTEYLSLWKSSQTLIFDLGNLINDKYTGAFNATLTATFLQASEATEPTAPADVILPISARKGSDEEASVFVLPEDTATNSISFPRNANRAVFSLSANGQANEEFWWQNLLQSDVYTFNETYGAYPGFSPFREVQVLIDGQPAGAQWPFPVIFTGGVVPSLHRPIVGLQAFDLREQEIDITPWLPLLCDGSQHTFTIRVGGLDNSAGSDGTKLTKEVGESWYVTGKIFVWLDEDADSVTTGTKPVVEFGPPVVKLGHSLAQNSSGYNETLDFHVSVQRVVSVKSTVTSQSQTGKRSWSQTLSYSNNATVGGFGYVQTNDFLIEGSDKATGPETWYQSDYKYPLYCNSTYAVDPDKGNITIEAYLAEGMHLRTQGDTIYPTGLEAFADVGQQQQKQPKGRFTGSAIDTSRHGTGSFFQTGDGKNSSGFGTTNQKYYFGGLLGGGGGTTELYFRDVTAVNNTVVADRQREMGTETAGSVAPADDRSTTMTASSHILSQFA